MIGGGGSGRLIKGDVQDQALFSKLEVLLIFRALYFEPSKF